MLGPDRQGARIVICDELKSNSKRNLEDTLENLASFEEQRRYKAAVPFVHIPLELLEQWSDHRRKLREVDWFRPLYSPAEHAAFARLDEVIQLHARRFVEIDVPEIFEDEAWSSVKTLAQEALDTIRRHR